jgi:hypothetical protein
MIIDLQTTFLGLDRGRRHQDRPGDHRHRDLDQRARSAPGCDADARRRGHQLADLWLVVQADQSADFAAAGAATLTITLESDTAVGLATSPAVHFATAAIAKATLVKGYVAVRTLLPSATTSASSGCATRSPPGRSPPAGVLAFLTPTLQRNKTYPVGFAVT